jgi:hypothetical protein
LSILNRVLIVICLHSASTAEINWQRLPTLSNIYFVGPCTLRFRREQQPKTTRLVEICD